MPGSTAVSSSSSVMKKRRLEEFPLSRTMSDASWVCTLAFLNVKDNLSFSSTCKSLRESTTTPHHIVLPIQNSLTQMCSSFEADDPLLYQQMRFLFSGTLKIKNHERFLKKISDFFLGCLIRNIPTLPNTLCTLSPLVLQLRKEAQTTQGRLSLAQMHDHLHVIQDHYKAMVQRESYIEAMQVVLTINSRSERMNGIAFVFSHFLNHRANDKNIWLGFFNITPRDSKDKRYLSFKKNCIYQLLRYNHYDDAEKFIFELPEDSRQSSFLELCDAFMQLGKLHEVRRIAHYLEDHEKMEILADADQLEVRQNNENRIFGTQESFVIDIEEILNGDFDEEAAIGFAQRVFNLPLRNSLLSIIEERSNITLPFAPFNLSNLLAP